MEFESSDGKAVALVLGHQFQQSDFVGCGVAGLQLVHGGQVEHQALVQEALRLGIDSGLHQLDSVSDAARVHHTHPEVVDNLQATRFGAISYMIPWISILYTD